MSDIGEMTEKRKIILDIKYKMELDRLHIKRNELEIRKLEKEEELENILDKIKEVEEHITNKKEEITS